MPSVMEEGNFQFDFSKAVAARKADEKGRVLPVGLKTVDFVVEFKNFVLLIEVKAPPFSNGLAKKAVERFMANLSTNQLVSDSLVPKIRDSYTYCHLMKEDVKPIKVICLLEIDDSPLLATVSDILKKRVAHEAELPWQRRHVEVIGVVNSKLWHKSIGKLIPLSIKA